MECGYEDPGSDTARPWASYRTFAMPQLSHLKSWATIAEMFKSK